jgi:uncharacterized membrane-anchored protein
MLKKLVHAVAAVLLIGGFSLAWADAPAQPKMTPEQLEASLKYQSGKVSLPGGMATLDLPAGFRYLDPANANRLLVDGWGNPPGATTLGMIVPADVSPLSEQGWGVVITYDEDGHVKDDDAATIKYDELLKQLQEDAEEESKERVKAGYPAMKLAAWAEPPHYDQASHKLYWALDYAVGNATVHSLNYKIRVLGRKGVLVLNAVAGMDQLAGIKTEMQKVVAFTDFTPGNAYADFNGSTDKVAEYGIAALVLGGVAAKLGLFAKLLALIIAFKKAIIIGAVALFAGIKKLLGLKKKEEPAPETRE